ncbi:MAG: hypothetical protein A2202_05285 [Bdellovibrionales bacterium RIFOXYA1_FULL_36_14]|nr:MAG: hypothetical protein A2202_05285 [Bdellovibrionales bacterium RIFOXYA1_FULL_36_14]
MKKFIIFLIVFVCFRPFAHSEELNTVLELVKDDILITHPLKLDQKFKKKIQIIRSRISPAQVNILFKYNLKAEECILWEESLVTIPGYYELRCEMIGSREECQNIWIEEHQQLEKKCKQFEEQIQLVFKKIIFDFSSATKLSANQREVFEVDLNQPKLDSGKFEIKGRVMEANGPYEISSRSLLHKYQTVYFVKK